MIKIYLPLLSFLIFSLIGHPSREEIFNKIYDESVWGVNDDGEANSGGGSTLEATQFYRQFLQDFLTIYNIQSVVDLGCGDWEFSKAINWNNIDYIGYDLVASIITKNQAKYGKENIHFIQADFLITDLKPADLLICKDVLQHLSNHEIALFIKQLGKFKFSLITNDVDHDTLSSRNREIFCGGYRTLDLTKAPFFLKGKKVFTFKSCGVTKQVFLVTRVTCEP